MGIWREKMKEKEGLKVGTRELRTKGENREGKTG